MDDVSLGILGIRLEFRLYVVALLLKRLDLGFYGHRVPRFALNLVNGNAL